MWWVLVFSVFILGLIVGSFLNVVILRTRTGMGIGGRSHCFSCNKTLRWYELLPVVSFIIQRGRCRRCHSQISAQYPIVEFVTGVAFVLPMLAFPIVGLNSLLAIVIAWICASVAMVVSVYDIKHQMIPVNGLLVIGALGLMLMLLPSLFDIAIGLQVPVAIFDRVLAGLLIPLPFFLIWVFSKGRLFGLGDVELMIPIGLSLGIVLGVTSLLFAFWSATLIVGILIFVRSRLLQARKGGILKQAIPFGPFLLGAWYVMLVFGHPMLKAINSFLFV